MTVESDHGIVAEALDQCMEDFKRGLNSHGSPTPSVSQEIVGNLRAGMVKYFHKNLVENGRKWHGSKGDCMRVTRMAFYLGAIAAFRADADSHAAPNVTPEHVGQALEYVRKHCKGRGIRITWIYCDWP